MKTNKRVVGAVGTFGIAAALSGTLYAQGELADTPEDLTLASPFTDDFDQNLSLEQMVPLVDEILAGIATSEQNLTDMQGEATEARDVVKVVCLGDKSSQFEQASEAAQERGEEFDSAVTENNLEKGRHQYSMIVVIGDRVVALMSEANQCVGAEDTAFAGESETLLAIDSNLPEPIESPEPIAAFIAGEEPTVQSPDG